MAGAAAPAAGAKQPDAGGNLTDEGPVAGLRDVLLAAVRSVRDPGATLARRALLCCPSGVCIVRRELVGIQCISMQWRCGTLPAARHC